MAGSWGLALPRRRPWIWALAGNYAERICKFLLGSFCEQVRLLRKLTGLLLSPKGRKVKKGGLKEEGDEQQNEREKRSQCAGRRERGSLVCPGRWASLESFFTYLPLLPECWEQLHGSFINLKNLLTFLCLGFFKKTDCLTHGREETFSPDRIRETDNQ